MIRILTVSINHRRVTIRRSRGETVRIRQVLGQPCYSFFDVRIGRIVFLNIFVNYLDCLVFICIYPLVDSSSPNPSFTVADYIFHLFCTSSMGLLEVHHHYCNIHCGKAISLECRQLKLLIAGKLKSLQ
jgi:hypothetical protein